MCSVRKGVRRKLLALASNKQVIWGVLPDLDTGQNLTLPSDRSGTQSPVKIIFSGQIHLFSLRSPQIQMNRRL